MQKKVPVDHYGLTCREGEEYHPDPFLHEQYLLIEENGKRILISGCSHKGIINLVSWFKPDILIGGFHYMKLDASGDGAEILKHSAETLLESPTMYYTGHCTGSEPFAVLKQYMGDRLEAISTGMVIEL